MQLRRRLQRYLTVMRGKVPLPLTYDDIHDVSTQALTDLLAQAAEENRRRVWELRLIGVRLQCLRCRSEFTRQGKEEEDEQEEQQQGEEPEIVRRRRLVESGEEGTQRHDGEKGEKWV